jgi:hypothetical protein
MQSQNRTSVVHTPSLGVKSVVSKRNRRTGRAVAAAAVLATEAPPQQQGQALASAQPANVSESDLLAFVASIQAQLSQIRAAQAIKLVPDLPTLSDPALLAVATIAIEAIQFNPEEGEPAVQTAASPANSRTSSAMARCQPPAF